MKVRILFAIFLIALLAASCQRDDVPTIPSYLHLDKVNIAHATEGTSIYGEGFLTSEVDAVGINCWFDGIDTIHRLGTFQLPCDIPLLCHEHNISRIQIFPIVKQNGIAGTHIWYPYYKDYKDSNIVVNPTDTTFLGTQDADGKWSITCHYRNVPPIKILAQEYFEPVQQIIAFDTMAERINGHATACSGDGYGRIKFSKGVNSVNCFIEDWLQESDATSYLYLEMDYWTDCRLAVGLQGSTIHTGTNSITGAVTLYPNSGWQKIYINLGKAWRQLNYATKFRVVLTALNNDDTDGFVRIDNVKVLSYPLNS